MTSIRILKRNICKIRNIALIIALVLLFYFFQNYRKSIFNKSENIKYENELKKKFNEKTFFEIDQSKEIVLTNNVDNITLGILTMEQNYRNKELEEELLRRKKFNFYWKIKTETINESLSKIIFSFKQNQFITYVYNENDWQLNLFGLSRPYIVKSLNYGSEDSLPEVANGYLGISGFSDEVQMQSLFSGSNMETHRASIPSWTIRNITEIFDVNGHNIVMGRRLQLDMSNGRLSQTLFSEHCIIEQQIYVHQTLKSLIVHEIQIQFINSSLNTVVLKLPKDRKRDVSSNIDITEEFDSTLDNQNIKVVSGVTHTNDIKNHQQHIHAYYNAVPEEIRITKSNFVKKHYYIMSVNEDKKTAYQHFTKGIFLIEDDNKLFKDHDLVWKNLWLNTGVFMRRSNSLDIPLISAQYLINSNLPSIGHIDNLGALGATGLGVISNQGVGHSLETNCGGRIEFTQELWMLNSQMLLHPQSVKSIINKRILQLPMAKSSAQYFNYDGAKYPAATNELGEDLCKTNINCENIRFPSGIVAMSFHKYLLATGDHSMFTDDTCLGVLKEINKFWKSNIKKYELGTISGSVPLTNLNLNVNNSVFNAGLMKESLLIIPELINFFDDKPDDDFASYILELHSLSESISVNIDKIHRSFPPYSEYEKVNGAWYLPEGVMLRYPLDHIVDSETNGRNLRFYENRLLQPLNPMSLSVLFINNMDADRISEAEENFRTLIKFSDNIFKVWINDSNLWQGSYLPAASSYLDSIMFGLLGLRIRRSGLYIFPKLILDVSFIQVSNIQYLGSTIEIIVDQNRGLFIQIISKEPNASKLGASKLLSQKVNILDNRVMFPLATHIVIKRLKTTSNENL